MGLYTGEGHHRGFSLSDIPSPTLSDPSPAATLAEANAVGDQALLPVSIRIGNADLALWPEGQVAEPMSAPLMAITTFKDWGIYHSSLIEAALAAEQDPQLCVKLFRGGFGSAG